MGNGRVGVVAVFFFFSRQSKETFNCNINALLTTGILYKTYTTNYLQ